METRSTRKGTFTKRQSDGNRPARGSYAGNGRPGTRKTGERKSGDRPEEKRFGGKKFGEKKIGERKFGERNFTERKPAEKRYGERKLSGRTLLEKPKKTVKKVEDDGMVRLNKYIANSGVCSRREADTYIQTGLVKVNGEVVTELGTKIDPLKDEVRFNESRIHGEKKVYIVMNKPKDFVTTTSDPHAENTVMNLISASKCPERVYPVGRLDKDTTGVLLFTNDGEMAARLTHPSYQVKKIYHAFLDKKVAKADLDQLAKGITLEDGPIAVDAISYVDEDKTQVGLEIHSGRNRIVRRMFNHLGYKVKKLDRVYFAGITKKNIRRGEWRFLTQEEINLLRMGAVK